jgi:predicted nuclease with TOPRIM domain
VRSRKGLTLTPCPQKAFKEREPHMKKEDLKRLIEEHLVLRKKIEKLQEEVKKLEDRYEEVGRLLYGFRSKEFLRSVLSFLVDLRAEYGEDGHFDDLFERIFHCLRDYQHIEEPKDFMPKRLSKVYYEKIE